ncbi:MAG: antibiotic biosynthesis monooxygenase [Acidobacteriia bacterium]|nr:antibiotic biosynthesis monooxygenase [Terriglobia bacterium]
MDDRTSVRTQMEQEHGPVILINQFVVEPEDAEGFLKLWAEDAAIMKRQPGFISAQMHKGVGDSRVFLNYAVWESVADFKRAFHNPEFQAKIRAYPSSIVASPHLFKKLSVPGICVD